MGRERPFIEAQEATWPAAEIAELGPWRARFSRGGGRRVGSARPRDPEAASAQRPELLEGLSAIEAWYRAREAPAYLQFTDAQVSTLGAEVEARGWRAEAPTRFYSAPVADVAARPLSTDRRPYLIHVKAPLAAVDALWREDGISAGRRAVMARAKNGAIWVARVDHRVGGAVFVSVGDRETPSPRVAQIHGLYIAPWARRRQAAADLVSQAARWAETQGAAELSIDVLAENASARALYERIGCVEAGGYVYYRKETSGAEE